MKIPKNIYIKDYERERLETITNKINEERIKNGKKPLKTTYIIHEIINKGLLCYENLKT